MEKAQDAVAGAAEKVQDMASGAVDTAKDWASGVASGAECAYGATRDSLGEAEAFIRRYPLPSVLGAIAVGGLIGCAMSRRS
jgi:ElaB/YqjD/DUF883 family membrane-anchored ribosome-binding protein